jgi:hypothetical protein
VSHSDKEVSIVLSKFDSTSLIHRSKEGDK